MAEWITFIGSRQLETGEWTDKQDFREPIVRCQDCKFYEKYDDETWCETFDFVTLTDISNGFCAWGEKKQGGEISELKPCPFCGGEFTQVRYMGLDRYPSAFQNGYRGECCDCGAVTRAFETEAEAMNAWNTRAVE